MRCAEVLTGYDPPCVDATEGSRYAVLVAIHYLYVNVLMYWFKSQYAAERIFLRESGSTAPLPLQDVPASACDCYLFGRFTWDYELLSERLGVGGRSAKEFEEYGRLMAAKYLVSHSRSPHYKALLKAVLKAALAPLPVQVRPTFGKIHSFEQTAFPVQV